MRNFSIGFWTGFGGLLFFGFVAAFAPLIATRDPNTMDLKSHHIGPKIGHSLSDSFLLGADEDGEDIFSQIVYGARVSLSVGLSVVFVSSALGLIVGSIAGFKGGIVDELLMRFIDLLHAFPGFLLALSLVAVLGPSVPNLIFAMCLTGWTSYARLVRGEVQSLKHRDYVSAAYACGATNLRIMLRHIWPNLMSPLLVQASFGFAAAILTESGLSFLGLGVPAEVPSWGSLLSAGRRSLLEGPHISLFPGLAIIAAVLSFHLVGNGIREHLDPQAD